MVNDFLSEILPLFGVVMGAYLAFFTQYLLKRQEEKSDIRKKAIDVKNKYCLAVWETLSDTHLYLFFSGDDSPAKINVKEFGEHINVLNVAIIRAEPFVSHQSYELLMGVRYDLYKFFKKLEASGPLNYEDYKASILNIEKQIDMARDIMRNELQLISLGITCA